MILFIVILAIIVIAGNVVVLKSIKGDYDAFKDFYGISPRWEAIKYNAGTLIFVLITDINIIVLMIICMM